MKQLARLSSTELHSLRKSLRKLSYDAHSLAVLFGRRAGKRYLLQCSKALALLGVINDAAMTRALAGRPVADQGSLKAPAGALIRQRVVRERRARRSLKAALEPLRAVPAFWPSH